MARMVVIYSTPKDPRSFDDHYFSVHIPLAKKLPGLLSYSVSRRPILCPAGDPAPYLVGILDFADMGALSAAFASPEGQACAADRRILAGDDELQMYIFESDEV